MKEKEMEAFIDRLTQNKEAGEKLNEPANTQEEQELCELWEDLGSLKEDQPRNRKLVSEFQDKLEVYRDGWEASQISTANREAGSTISNSWIKRALPYAMAACAALVLFVAGAFSGNLLSGGDALRNELSKTRETLALALLNQSSASRQLAGLSEASKVEMPSAALRLAIIEALDHNPNVNVRLAAIDALGQQGVESVFDILISRLDTEESPLVQMDIIRLVLEVGNEADRLALLERLSAMPIAPRIKKYLDSAKERIEI